MQYVLHIARRQVHIARVKESRSLEPLLFLEEKSLAAILSSTAIEKLVR